MDEEVLYESPVYRVFYQYRGRYGMFDLKTLKGCYNRIEKNKYKVLAIEKIQRHKFDDSDIRILEKIKYEKKEDDSKC